MTKFDTTHLAVLAVAMSGLVWGILWIPLRSLDDSGINGAWAIVLFYLLPTLLLTPAILLRAGPMMRRGWPLQTAGMLAGLALVLYAGALVFTDVVRALLFYYLTPLWSTLLARAVIGEAITGARWGTIGLAFMGLLLIVNVGSGFGNALRPGDWMGLASGIVWAIAAVTMKSDRSGNGADFTLSYFVWGSVAALALAVLSPEGSTQAPDWQSMRAVLPWMVPVALLLIIPPAFAIMWGATVLSPGLLGILFMTEISTGTITAALWANEPFGAREIAGVTLITAAGVLEPALGLCRRKA